MGRSAAGMVPQATSAWRPFAASRLGILLVAVLAAAVAGGHAQTELNSERFGAPALTEPFGAFADALLSPLARWDAVWYLSIADSGYGAADSPRVAFFPLYPLLARGVAELGGGSPAALLVGAYAVSLLALLGALVLLYRLTRLELGREPAATAVVLLCVFPASFFLGAPYSESLFLLASVGAFLAARTGHWAWAGMAAAAASATRSFGVLLLLPLLLIYLYGPRADRAGESARFAVRRDALWLGLAPLGLAAYAAYLGLAHGDGLAFLSAQEQWSREFAGPLSGLWQALSAAFEGARVLASGPPEAGVPSPLGSPAAVAAQDILLLGFLAFAVAATVGVLRRLPIAYGAYTAVALAVPLSYPMESQPLMSLPRFLVVLFPLFMWLALVCRERRITPWVAGASALALVVLTSRFAAWHWVA